MGEINDIRHEVVNNFPCGGVVLTMTLERVSWAVKGLDQRTLHFPAGSASVKKNTLCHRMTERDDSSHLNRPARNLNVNGFTKSRSGT